MTESGAGVTRTPGRRRRHSRRWCFCSVLAVSDSCARVCADGIFFTPILIDVLHCFTPQQTKVYEKTSQGRNRHRQAGPPARAGRRAAARPRARVTHPKWRPSPPPHTPLADSFTHSLIRPGAHARTRPQPPMSNVAEQCTWTHNHHPQVSKTAQIHTTMAAVNITASCPGAEPEGRRWLESSVTVGAISHIQ